MTSRENTDTFEGILEWLDAVPQKESDELIDKYQNKKHELGCLCNNRNTVDKVFWHVLQEFSCDSLEFHLGKHKLHNIKLDSIFESFDLEDIIPEYSNPPKDIVRHLRDYKITEDEVKRLERIFRYNINKELRRWRNRE